MERTIRYVTDKSICR